ncbi:ATP-binding protein [Marinibaculum pumilum]|uniref:histidine kinase n=1 Tax=Marinibaculum pumilum TaxID=1766165 RepID=A0ABV7L9X0_9PROT
MLSANLILAVSLAYVALLFLVAFLGDRQASRGRTRWIQSPLIYTLSISVYCTSWTFYGAVGSAARNGLEFATIYLGPTLVFVGWWFLLRKLVRIGRVHRITSIADLISSRYGKSNTLAVMVTLIAVIGSTPYIALQLKAVTTSFQVIGGDVLEGLTGLPAGEPDFRAAFWIAAGMALFTILFGTRNIDANERHHGVVAAIALEALVKLVALVAVGIFVVFALADGPSEIFDRASPQILHSEEVFGPRWIALTFLAATAVICLPRQFQVTVVENSDERHLATAAWMFPLYMFLMSLFILPIAIGGLHFMPEGANPDMFVLTLPMSVGQDALAMLAFLGGFSSATSMVIVACIALSTMVSNHIVMPVALRLPGLGMHGQSGDVRQLLLTSRRISICLILALGFLYFRLSGKSDALAAIGLISFAGVAQFLPSIIGGLYWRQASAGGAVAGLAAGFALWAYTLFLPSFEGDFLLSQSVIANGPWGIAGLRPQSLFGIHDDALVNALFWSLGVNTIVFVLGSLFRDLRPLEQLQSALFVDVFRSPLEDEHRFIRRFATAEDLFVLAQRILGPEKAHRIFRDFARRQGRERELPEPSGAFIAYLERQLAGSVGAASARAMVSQVASGETISLNELMTIANETARLMEYSRQVEQKSQELEAAAAQLRAANERLQRLDAEKDDFLSQVSHEVRTPMTSIRSFSEILLESRDLSSDQAQRFIGIIHEESLRLTRLLDEILDLNLLERGEASWQLARIDAQEAVGRAIDTCQGLARSAGVALERIGPLPALPVQADADRLRQVFINLLTNAVIYNTAPAPRVLVECRMEGGRAVVEVSDNGTGIDAEQRRTLFTKFSRNWARAKPGGAGLGLAISWQIMHRLGGALDLLPARPGEGARFRVSLPLAAAETAAAPQVRG